MSQIISPEESAFMEYVNRKINRASALGIELPFDSIHDEIYDALLYFYEWYPLSTQETTLGLRYEDMMRYKGNGPNIPVPLPEFVQTVTDLNIGRGTYGKSVNDMFRIAFMKNALSANGGNSIATGNNNTQSADFGSAMVSMYEVNMFRQMTKKGLRFTYNNLSGIFNIMGHLEGDLLLFVEQRLPVEMLFNDRLFRNYVAAQCMSNIAGIITTFTIELPHGVTLNAEMLNSKGEKEVDKIEDEIEKMNNTSFIHTW